MAKLTGPLLSFGANGQVAKTMVTATWKGVKYARQYTIPANPQTAEQSKTRDVFSFLNSWWLVAPALARAPWTANAVGQKYTDRNKLLKENITGLRGQTDCNNFIGSPGSLGGPPLAAIGSNTGAVAGDVGWTATAPTVPTGWTLAGVIAIAFEDQDPSLPFAGTIIAGEDDTAAYSGTLSGLTAGATCQLNVWPKWTRPDGRTAYGPALTTQQAAHA